MNAKHDGCKYLKQLFHFGSIPCGQNVLCFHHVLCEFVETRMWCIYTTVVFFFSFLNTAVCRIHDDEVKDLFEAKINNCDMTMVKQSRLGFGAVYHQTTERLFFLRLWFILSIPSQKVVLIIWLIQLRSSQNATGFHALRMTIMF